MDKPRVLSVKQKAFCERAPPDAEGARIVEFYDPYTKAAQPGPQDVAKETGLLGGIFAKIRSIFEKK